ncbi:hypothetical protein E8E13_001698 [Curvularia kusanoi]|uniref:Uncharacterized protein n=1 Tax=Curvularia kusanoi TaxID=90978 RepID=A0A9P4W8G6_CURKU|nr:hypothetical protein E8E13_001698 [Curvularia kusanoi]
MLAEAMTTTAAAMAAFGTQLSDSRIGCWSRASPDFSSSVSRCSTTYGSAPPPWGPSTDFFTSTSYAYRVKTQILTPKAITTSVSTTSTYTEYETAPNNLTKTIYTDTYTWTNYLTTTETAYTTSTITTSVLSSTTVPTPDGFTPVAAYYPQATQHVDDWADRDNWAVEDEYFQDEGDDPWIIPLALDAAQPVLLDAAAATGISSSSAAQNTTTSSGPQPSKVDCLVTVVNVYEAGTSTTKSYVPPPTYTRTAYVSTETITSTITTKISPTETPYTYSMASGLEISSWYTETTTSTETVTTTEYPSSTTTLYAACATNNIIDTYNNFPIDRLADDWERKNLTIIRSSWSDITNATACCATAAQQPNAIFFTYNGQCEVFVDNGVANLANSSGQVNVEVLYEPRQRGWWSLTVGNGPKGRISFSSLWL